MKPSLEVLVSLMRITFSAGVTPKVVEERGHSKVGAEIVYAWSPLISDCNDMSNL
jgi:hypothetical protein